MLRVAVIEDDPELRKFMEETINGCSDFYLAGSYGSAEEYKKDFYRMADLDVAVMDINLPASAASTASRK
jgi:chemotaxis response regulator CheB